MSIPSGDELLARRFGPRSEFHVVAVCADHGSPVVGEQVTYHHLMHDATGVDDAVTGA